MTEAEVVTYMKTTLGSITDAVNLTDEALGEAAKFTEFIYGEPVANITDGVKFRVIADFCALNAALNFAAPFYKFSADSASVEGNDVFEHLNARWKNALAMAQTYLTDAGLNIVVPGSVVMPHNYGVRYGGYDTNYLLDEKVGF